MLIFEIFEIHGHFSSFALRSISFCTSHFCEVHT